MPTAEKNYSSPFVLDKPKLSRMLNILEERFHGNELSFTPRYSVTLTNDKRVEVGSLDELFKLDNTVRNPVKSLIMDAGAPTSDADLSTSIEYSSSNKDNISLRVLSNDSNLTLQLFAELEEQVERTFLTNWVYRFFKTPRGSTIAVFALSAVFVIIGVLFSPRTRNPSELNLAEIRELADESKSAVTLEDKVDFLFELNRRQLEVQLPSPPLTNPEEFFNLRGLFVLLPLAVVIGCAVYVVMRCYPLAVFLWGDYEEHYARLVSLRNTLWTVVILSIVLGVIANMFVLGLSGLIETRP